MTSTRAQTSPARRRAQPPVAAPTREQQPQAQSPPATTTRDADEETVQQAGHTPIYSALVSQWTAERRAVPGDFDQEWSTLVDYASWRRRQPLPRAQEA